MNEFEQPSGIRYPGNSAAARRTYSFIRLLFVVGACSVLLAACRAPAPRPLPAGETGTPPTAVVAQQTVIVTAMPAPAPSATPFYVSRVDTPAGVLVYPLDAAPAGLDPQEDDDDASAVIQAQLYEGLYDLRGDGQLAPAAASGYQVSAGGDTYTVTLRSGLVWSDGRAVTAQDYVVGVCRALSPAIGSRFAYLLSEVAGIRGAAAYAAGTTADCGQVGVAAVDATTLRITLGRPLASFPQLLATRAFWPALPGQAGPAAGTATAAPGPTVPVVAAGTAPTVPAATLLPANGPYVVAEWQTGDHVTLVKNPRFWAAAQVGIAKVEMPVLPGADAQWAVYRQGKLHVAEVPAGLASVAWTDPALRRELQVLPQPGTSYLGINTAITPTANLAVRRAIAAAVDRTTIISDVLTAPWHTPAGGLLPSGLGPGAPAPRPAPAYEPAAAARLLAEAGYTAANPPPTINLWANREGQNTALAAALADMLERAGLPTRLVLSSWPVFQRALAACGAAPATCDDHLFLEGWVMDTGDPARFLGAALGAAPATGYTGWLPADYTAALAQAAGIPDAATRAGLYGRAEGLLLDQAVVVPLLYYDRLILVKPGVQTEYPLFGPVHLRYWTMVSSP